MVEYIDRQEAINAVLSCFGVEDSIFSDATVMAIGFKLKDIPAADVQPVKHGKWILDYGVPWNVIECSECGEKWHHWQGHAMPNYCSNCGAKMDGAE